MKGMKRTLAWVVALAMLLPVTFGTARSVYAADPAGVTRVAGTTATTMQVDEFGTITVDPGLLNLSKPYTMDYDGDNFEVGTVANNGYGDTVPRVSINYTKTIPANSNVSLSDVIKLTFPDTATLEDGSKADVRITYSNIQFANQGRIYKNRTKGTTHDILPGASFFYGSFVGVAFHSKDDEAAWLGMNCDFKLEVVDKSGNVVDGTILFEVVDLDVANVLYENQDNNVYSKPSNYENEYADYRESVVVKSGSASNAFIPASNKLDISGSGSEGNANGVRFSSTVGDENTLDTGFVMLVNNGAEFTWYGSSSRIIPNDPKAESYGAGMGTTLFTAKAIHILRCTTTKGGTIQQDLNGAETKVGEEGAITVGKGKTVTYTMTPEEGYELSKVMVDGKEITPVKNEDGTYSFTFEEIDANHRIDVSWDPIVTTKSGSGGSIDPGETVPFGTDKTFTATPDEGYGLKTVKYNGEEVDPEDPSTWPVDDNGDPVLDIVKNEDGSYSITLKNVEDPASLEVEWAKLYTVTFEDGDHGTSEGGDQTDVSEGDYPEGGNTVTPNDGYKFSGKYKYVITKDDGTTEEGETDDPTSVPVTGDIVFTPIYDPVVTATSGEGGGISDPGDTTVPSGSSKTYTFTPEPGYTVGKVTVNGQEVAPTDNGDGTWSYTLENVTEPTTIDVQWVPTVWVKYVDPDGKTIYMDETTFAKGGEEPAGPANPTKDGFTFAGWEKTVDEDGNITYTAKWEPIPEKIWVQYVDPDGKTIYMEKTEFEKGGEEPAGPADPKKDGYVFDGWEKTVDENGNITYTAKWKQVLTPTAATKPADKAPKTGDSNNAMLFVMTILFSLAGLMAAVTSRRNVIRRRRK